MDSRDREQMHGKWYKSFDPSTMTLTVEDGNEELVEFRARYEVCGLCNGHGKHVNPSIDAHGISADEFYEDPDFADAYRAGAYDVTCYRCGGNRVEPVIDEGSADPEALAAWRAREEARESSRREYEMERRMGA